MCVSNTMFNFNVEHCPLFSREVTWLVWGHHRALYVLRFTNTATVSFTYTPMQRGTQILLSPSSPVCVQQWWITEADCCQLAWTHSFMLLQICCKRVCVTCWWHESVCRERLVFSFCVLKARASALSVDLCGQPPTSISFCAFSLMWFDSHLFLKSAWTATAPLTPTHLPSVCLFTRPI